MHISVCSVISDKRLLYVINDLKNKTKIKEKDKNDEQLYFTVRVAVVCSRVVLSPHISGERGRFSNPHTEM